MSFSLKLAAMYQVIYRLNCDLVTGRITEEQFRTMMDRIEAARHSQ